MENRFTNELLSDDIEEFSGMDEETKEDLRFLSHKAKGWAAWTDKDAEPVFVPIEQWKKIWDKYQK